MVVLYSASGQDLDSIVRQLVRGALAFGLMIGMAQLPPSLYARWSVPLFAVVVLLLIAVDVFGHIGKGGPALARSRLHEVPALRGDETLHAHHGGRLAQPALPAAKVQPCDDRPGDGAAAHPADRGPTRSRHLHPGGRFRLLRHLPGGDQLVAHRARGLAHLRLHAGTLVLPDARLPAPAGADAAGPGEGPARSRLSHHPVQDCDRLRRRVRQGVAARHPVPARIPARAPHRLHLRRLQRGVRSGGVALLLVIYLYIISRCLFISMQAQNSFERLLGAP